MLEILWKIVLVIRINTLLHLYWGLVAREGAERVLHGRLHGRALHKCYGGMRF
jgi:hypothetical protein